MTQTEWDDLRFGDVVEFDGTDRYTVIIYTDRIGPVGLDLSEDSSYTYGMTRDPMLWDLVSKSPRPTPARSR